MFPLSTNLPPSPPFSKSPPLILPTSPTTAPSPTCRSYPKYWNALSPPNSTPTSSQTISMNPSSLASAHFTVSKPPCSKSPMISSPLQTPVPSTSCYYLTSAQPLIRSTIPSSLKGCVNRVLRALHLTGSPPTSPTATVRFALWPHIHPLSCHAGGPSGLSPQPPSFHLLPLPAWSHHPQPQRGLPLLR